MSNRDKVDKVLEALGGGLRPFVDRHMAATVPPGRDWVDLIEARDAATHGTTKSYSPRTTRRARSTPWSGCSQASAHPTTPPP